MTYMQPIDTPHASINWTFPSVPEPDYMVFTMNESYALPYGPFTGPDARQEAEAFAKRHIAPYSEQYSVVPLQDLTLYRRLDALRAHLADPARSGGQWTMARVCEWSHEDKKLPGMLSTQEAELLLDALEREGVLARQGERPVWIIPTAKETTK